MEHDQKKVKESLTDAQLAERKAAVDKCKALLEESFKVRDEWHAKNRSSASDLSVEEVQTNIAKITPLLEQNPDNYSIFAFRRELFDHLSKLMFPGFAEEKAKLASSAAAATSEQQEQQQPDQVDEEKIQKQLKAEFLLYFAKEILLPELLLNTEIIKRDYKSYAAWVHRRWILNTMHPKVRIGVLREENAQIEKLLSRDERNFHAWGYRRWVTGELKAAGLYSDDQELAFATSKIGNNFSNYSAWHNRALVLWGRIEEFLRDEQNETLLLLKNITEQVKADREMLVQAFYCDPNDQSAFVYCKNLVEKIHSAATTSSRGDLSIANEELQKAVRDACVELKEEEKQCYWPRFMLLQLPLFPVDKKDEAIQMWSELKELDPLRKHYFQYEIDKLSSA